MGIKTNEFSAPFLIRQWKLNRLINAPGPRREGNFKLLRTVRSQNKENRSVLAYDIVAVGDRPVVVTIASELGWSLVGVMGSAQIDAAGAIALISARGLDAAVRPFATTSAAAGQTSRIEWLGPTRNQQQRLHAKALASGRPLPLAARTAKKSRTRGGR